MSDYPRVRSRFGSTISTVGTDEPFRFLRIFSRRCGIESQRIMSLLAKLPIENEKKEPAAALNSQVKNAPKERNVLRACRYDTRGEI
jgi:hypothetical protein